MIKIFSIKFVFLRQIFFRSIAKRINNNRNYKNIKTTIVKNTLNNSESPLININKHSNKIMKQVNKVYGNLLLLFITIILSLPTTFFAQEGSGNWKGSQTGRKTSLMVPLIYTNIHYL